MKDNYYNHIFITEYIYHTTGTQAPQRTHLNIDSMAKFSSSLSLPVPLSVSLSYMKKAVLQYSSLRPVKLYSVTCPGPFGS